MDLLRVAFVTKVISLSAVSLFSQSSVFWKWEPHISLTWYPSDRWNFHSDISSLQALENGLVDGTDFGATERLEIKLFSTYRFFSGNRISLGYQYRSIDPFERETGSENRVIEQFAFVFQRLPFRIVNRIQMEQRFLSEGFQNRIRYRFSYDAPLNGNELDVGEAFLKATNEIMFAFNDKSSDWENRSSAGLGWLLTNRKKLEFILQYRVTDIGSRSRKQGFHIMTNFYISIPQQ
jgi:hypothetical protein